MIIQPSAAGGGNGAGKVEIRTGTVVASAKKVTLNFDKFKPELVFMWVPARAYIILRFIRDSKQMALEDNSSIIKYATVTWADTSITFNGSSNANFTTDISGTYTYIAIGESLD